MKRIATIIISLVVIAYMVITLALLSQHASFGSGPALRSDRMALADSAIYSAIANGDFPGAVLCVVARSSDGESMGEILYRKAYGNRQTTSGLNDKGQLIADTLPMSCEVVFDMASLSKSVGTTLAVMQLVEQGKIALSDNVSRYIPDFKPWESKPERRRDPIEREAITLDHLLTHTSGLPAAIHVPTFLKRYEKYGAPETMNLRDSLTRYLAEDADRRSRPGEKMVYSCLNFITLQAIIETVTQKRMDHFLEQEVFAPLQLKNTWYNHIDEEPPYAPTTLIAPTEIQSDGTLLCGEVHDPTARIVNRGVSGNAGLFSTADDLAVIASMLMNGGVMRFDEEGLAGLLGGSIRKRIFSEATIDRFLSLQPDFAEHGRTEGWASGFFGDLGSQHSINHTGYTGTSMAIDRERGIAVILLTNRVHPYDKGSLARTRILMSNIVAAALD